MATPDITERIPALLSARSVSTSAASNNGVLYDLTVSGIGFVFAIDSQNPYRRETVPVQKDQIDTSNEAGEQSLEGHWIRSQTSWHLGAGADYYEPGNRDEIVPTKFRYKDSRGVDVWSPGQLSLLREMTAVDATASTVAVCGARLTTGEDVWYSRDGGEVIRHDSGGATSHGTNAAIGGDLCAAGSKVLIGSTTGIFYTGLTSGAPAALITRAAGAMCTPYWVKGRVVTTTGPEVHENALTGGVLDATSLIWTHPDTAWTWSGVAEAPDAILAAGYSAGTSAIYAFLLTDGTTTTAPEITQPAVVAELPPGEEIRSLRSYLGSYLGIGTTAGIRIGIIGERGQVQYGPVLVETDDPVTTLGARDSFLYAGTGSSVIRVNLAEPIDDALRFPYAYDVEIPDGETITSLAFDGVTDRVVVGANGFGTYAASETAYVSGGWLESGGIRYGTTAPKAFRTIDVDATTTVTSSVAVSSVVDGTVTSIVTLADGLSGLEIGLSGIPSPLAQLSYRLDLAGGSDTPLVEAVAIKAVPVPRRQRLVRYPVHIADRARDAKNTPFGSEGYATTVLEALEALEGSQTIVTVHDHTRPEQFEAVIEQVAFTRVQPRSPGTGAKNFGGIGEITVRTL